MLVSFKCKVAKSTDIETRVCLVSLVNPGVGRLSVVAEVSGGEPKPDLVVGCLHGVRAMDDVASNLFNKAVSSVLY